MTEQGANVPKAKQTVLGLYVTAREAYEQYRAAPDTVKVIDVRTPEEFMWVGHAPVAWKIPFVAVTYQWDAGKKQFPVHPLPDFLARVRQVATPNDTLMVMCRSGGRAAMAINLLAQAGFKKVYNIIDGMEGDAVNDPDSLFNGRRLKNGWKNAGCPWTYELTGDQMLLPASAG